MGQKARRNPMSVPPDPRFPALPSRLAPLTPDHATQEAVGRLLTSANIQFRRGLDKEAEAAVREALVLRPEDAAAWELLGDIHLAKFNAPAALESYRKALMVEPGRVSAEGKLARATLRQTEDKRIDRMGVAYASSDTAVIRPTDSGNQAKNLALVGIGSAFLPGLGQFVNGDWLKGGILAGTFLLLLFALSRVPAGRGGHGAAPSVLFWALIAVVVVVWIVALSDALLTANRQQR